MGRLGPTVSAMGVVDRQILVSRRWLRYGSYKLHCAEFLLWQRLAGEVVFIHINKCGGSSVEAALGIPVKIHDTAAARRRKIGTQRWEKAFTFALVRHPYSKVISHYAYRLKSRYGHFNQNSIGLNDWIHRAYGDRDPALVKNPQWFAPCLDWITDETGATIVDLVVRLEEVEATWPIIQARIGTDAQLPRRNTSGSDLGWADLDAQSRRIIDTHFSRDFEAFGYRPG
jgi:hypothetical protein